MANNTIPRRGYVIQYTSWNSKFAVPEVHYVGKDPSNPCRLKTSSSLDLVLPFRTERAAITAGKSVAKGKFDDLGRGLPMFVHLYETEYAPRLFCHVCRITENGGGAEVNQGITPQDH